MKKKLVFILTVVFLSVSCSRLDIAVNLANSYIVHKTDDYFDLTKEQSKRLKESLAKDINQVKKTIFPQLAAEMLKIADTVSIQKTFDSTFVSATYQRIENLFMEGVRIFTPTAVALAGDLSPNQITVFQKEVDEKLNDLKKDSEKKSFDKMKKQFDSWFGSMTSNQKDDLKKFVEKNPGPTKLSVYNRQTLAHNFVRAFPDKNTRKKYVEKIFNQYDSMKETNYAKEMEEHKKKMYAYVANFLNKMNDAQRSTLIETIRDRANQLLKISKG